MLILASITGSIRNNDTAQVYIAGTMVVVSGRNPNLTPVNILIELAIT